MYACEHWDLGLRNDLIITKKRKHFPELNPDFI